MKSYRNSILSMLILISLVISGCGGAKEPIKEVTNEATIESIDIEVRGDTPKQVVAQVKGVLPDGCTEVHQISPTKEGDQIIVQITTVRTSGIECDKNPILFSENITLPVFNLPAGVYDVVIQGSNEIAGTFEFLTDNTLKTEAMSSDATIKSIDIELIGSQPTKVIVTITGTLKDPCTSLEKIEQKREDDTYKVTVVTARTTHTMCNSQAKVPFEETIELDTTGLELGVYKVDVQGVTGLFEIK